MFSKVAFLAAFVALAHAKDYPGSWLPGSPKEQCVDICVGSSPVPGCFKDANGTALDPNCLTKKVAPGDFDYLLLEQLYVPQFCRDLLKGADSTVSHQNVLPFPEGVRCKESVVKNELTIHATIPNRPFNAAKFAKDQALLLKEMSEKWIEPTVDNSYDTLCEIYNHEFQKHGLCYKTFDEDYDKAAAFYFRSTLNVAKLVDGATAKLNALASSPSATTTLKEVEALYSKKVQVLCSGVDGKNQLSAIRTCWNKPADITLDTVFEQRDCYPASKMGAFNGSTNAPTTAPTQLPTGKPGKPTENPAQQQQQTKPSTPGQQQQQQTPSTPAKPAQGSSTPSTAGQQNTPSTPGTQAGSPAAPATQNGSPVQQQQQQQQQKATSAPTKNAC
ncbi:TPA: hypothetical protein N0F65_007450 [Lagenidium giganteum]|uniref:Uncharacterized protein n=1 Tax=Lagenidium giganteum TaxID=4803 RepID=A0AAV2ZEE7_9STRA|nr:TPA: hypothetical protein N0F65_007450 [Lagenidium giganteum]